MPKLNVCESRMRQSARQRLQRLCNEANASTGSSKAGGDQGDVHPLGTMTTAFLGERNVSGRLERSSNRDECRLMPLR